MSEQISSREIEDVLSSIRRLVSDELRPVSRAVVQGAARPVPADEKTPEKLLLTPALRVVGAAGTEPSVERVVSVLGAAVRNRPQDWESETGDPAPVGIGRAVPAGQSAVIRPDFLRSDARLSAVPDAEAWPEADAQISDPAQADHGFTHSWAAEAPRHDPVWADQAEADVRAELDAAFAPDQVEAPSATTGQAMPGDVILDEAMLRDLVRDLIREELAGKLGERITRNIRKLVHAEIARTLASHDFD